MIILKTISYLEGQKENKGLHSNITPKNYLSFQNLVKLFVMSNGIRRTKVLIVSSQMSYDFKIIIELKFNNDNLNSIVILGVITFSPHELPTRPK
jgi:hypothetical protein